MHNQAGVLEEAIQFKNKTASCFEIALKCKRENDDVKRAIKKVDCEIVCNSLRQTEIKSTQDIIKELEFCDADTFPLLYAFKKENLNAQNDLCLEAEADFKKQRGDPEVYKIAEQMNRDVANKRRRQQRILKAAS